jgi:hypothetical protein
MKKAVLIVLLAALAVAAPATFAKGGGHGGSRSSGAAAGHSAGTSHAVRSYTKKDGIRVAATRATNPNKTQRDNYSTKGNVNPSNGRAGTKEASK